MSDMYDRPGAADDVRFWPERRLLRGSVTLDDCGPTEILHDAMASIRNTPRYKRLMAKGTRAYAENLRKENDGLRERAMLLARFPFCDGRAMQFFAWIAQEDIQIAKLEREAAEFEREAMEMENVV